MQPRDELLHREGLDQIVVGAGLETGDAVGDRVARGEHEDRAAQTVGAQAPADREPVEARHGHVEHDEVGRRGLGGGQRGAAVGDVLDLEALGGQAARSIRRTSASSSTTSTRSGIDPQPPATSRRRKTSIAATKAGTAYSEHTHAARTIGAQSTGWRSSPCQALNCVLSR